MRFKACRLSRSGANLSSLQKASVGNYAPSEAPLTTHESVPLLIRLVVDENDDEEQVDATSRALRSELEELPGIEDARQATTAEATERAPRQGTRSAELITLGTVALAVLPGAVPALIDFLKEWLLRPGYR